MLIIELLIWQCFFESGKLFNYHGKQIITLFKDLYREEK